MRNALTFKDALPHPAAPSKLVLAGQGSSAITTRTGPPRRLHDLACQLAIE